MTKQTDTFRIPRQKRVKLVTPRSVYAKYTLIYALCYTAAFAVGCLLFHVTGGAENAQFDRRIAGSFDIGFVFQHQNLILRECGDLLRHKESAVCGKSLFDCLCCRNAVCSICAARACVLHGSFFSRLKHSF